MRIATSAETTAKMKRDLDLIRKWRVDGTPPSWSTASTASPRCTTFDEMSAVAQWLAKRELKGK